MMINHKGRFNIRIEVPYLFDRLMYENLTDIFDWLKIQEIQYYHEEHSKDFYFDDESYAMAFKLVWCL